MLNISPREREIAQLLAKGLNVNQIAQQLRISPHTVKAHKRRAFAKTGAVSSVDLAVKVALDDRKRG